MTQTIETEVTGLRTQVAGTVLVPGDPGYDEARALWHGDIDRRPAMIVRCTGPDDVAAALVWSQRQGREVFVRGGGHGFWDGGEAVMIDLSPLHAVHVDPITRRARVGGGATLAQLDAATQEHGLAVPAGTVSNTGVGGLTLGGGFGWLTTQHGLTIDNLESAQVVLADGRRVRASAHSHPDLFWALRGGGGNFGVVTEFEFRLHPVGPTVHLAMLFVESDRAAAALKAARDAVDPLPRTISAFLICLTAPPAPFVPEEHQGRPVAAVALAGFGSAQEHAAAVESLRAVVDPAFEMVAPLPYTALQQMMDENVPWGTHQYAKALYLTELPDAVLDELVARFPHRTSAVSQAGIFLLRGAYGEVPEEATALGGGRALRYVVVLEAIAPGPDGFAADRQWVRDTWTALRPNAPHDGAYVNLMSEYEEGGLRDTYGAAKYDRLRAIKRIYDPANVFRHNANIPPES